MKTVAAAGIVLAALLVPFEPVSADVVTDWNDIGASTVNAALPAERGNQGLDLSLMYIAMYMRLRSRP